MLKKIITLYFSKLSEGRILFEDLFKKRSAKKGIPKISDGEFFSYLNYEIDGFRRIKEAYRERNFDYAKRELVNYYRERRKPKFFFSGFDSERLRKRLSEFGHSYRHILESAEKTCAHIMQTTQGASKNFGTFIDWFSDFSGRSWVYCHISDLPKKFSDKHFQKTYDMTNLSVTQEFNKHHHLVDLGRAYFFTHNEKYAQEYVIELEDWIEKNPPNWGVNWYDPMTVSQRTISWLFSAGYFISSPHFSGETFCKFIKALLFHGAYIIEHINDRNTKPAKLIGLASALYILSSAFHEFEFTGAWREKAIRTLENEISVQFSSDGIHRERAIGLQCLLTEFLFLPVIWDKMNDQTASNSLRLPLEKSLDFLMNDIQPNGKAHMFGDMLITKVWRLTFTPQEDYKGLLALGALLFKRHDMKFISGSGFEDILWFFHEEGLKAYDRLTPGPPESKSKAFGEGGYFISRDGWERDSCFCFFHSEPKKKWNFQDRGMDGLTRHRDLLNFSLSIRGEPFIIETGSYHGKKKVSSYFTRTSAHNSIVVDGKEQSLQRNFKGTKKFLQLLKTKWLFTDEFDYIASGNPGFEDLKSLVIHRREIIFLKKKLWFLIKDSLIGYDEFHVELNFHFAPELEIILRGDYGCFIRGRKDFVRLNPYFPSDFSCSMTRGKLDPISGWYAKDLVKVEACYRLEYFSRAKLPVEIFTWISWARGEFRIPQKEELNEYFLNVNNVQSLKEQDPDQLQENELAESAAGLV